MNIDPKLVEQFRDAAWDAHPMPDDQLAAARLQATEQANARANKSWALMCEKMVNEARLQDQQRIAELEAKELDLYKQLAEAKLSALKGWQRYEQANSHRNDLLEAQLAERKPMTDEQIWKNDAIMAANSGYGATFETLREIVRAIEAAHGIGDKA